MSDVNYYNTEFGDDILLKIIIEDEADASKKTFVIGRMESIRYEDTEELKEVRAIGTKYRVDARTTNFRGIFRCRMRPSAVNTRLLQYALGARVAESDNISLGNTLLADAIYDGDVTPPIMMPSDDLRYVVPYTIRVEIRNVRTGFQDELDDLVFTRRSKDVTQGDFTVMELEGEYGYSKLASSLKNS
jgi:hypothetical protein